MPSVLPMCQRYRRSIVICLFALSAYIGSAAILWSVMGVRSRPRGGGDCRGEVRYQVEG
jgi:hypothetical protein